MTRIIAGVTAVVLGLAATGSALAQSARSDIQSAVERFEQAFNAGDAAAIAAQYTEDAALLPPDSSRVDGRARVEGYWQGLIDAGLSNLDLIAEEIEASGDIAYEVGTFSLDAPAEDGEVAEVMGQYVVIWQKGPDGQWRLHRDIWNIPPAE